MAASTGTIVVGSSVVGQGPALGHINTSGQGVGQVIASGQGIIHVNAFPDEKKIRELAEQIRGRLSHAHQLKLTASQQQQATPAATMQVFYTPASSPLLCPPHCFTITYVFSVATSRVSISQCCP